MGVYGAIAIGVVTTGLCASQVVAECVDNSQCVEAKGGFEFLMTLGYSCDSTVMSVAEQIGPEAEQAVEDAGLGEVSTIGDFCPNLCTEICADIPADESCGGTDYCNREIKATMTLAGAFSDIADVANFQTTLATDICEFAETSDCLSGGVTAQAGSVVASFSMQPTSDDVAMTNMMRLECQLLAEAERSEWCESPSECPAGNYPGCTSGSTTYTTFSILSLDIERPVSFILRPQLLAKLLLCRIKCAAVSMNAASLTALTAVSPCL